MVEAVVSERFGRTEAVVDAAGSVDGLFDAPVLADSDAETGADWLADGDAARTPD